MRRMLALLAVVVLALLLSAGPAAADPAGPTNYRSVVTAVEGETAGGVEAEVLGGDAFIVLEVPAGVEVEVPGYDDEPYVRIGPDGRVEVNQRSPSHWFNEDRYGADVPEVAAVDATPAWREVAEDGVYAWHEHRIHWMSPSPPGQVDTSAREPQEVFDWEIPLTVDGAAATIRGELAWHPGPSAWVPLAWLVAGLLVAALLVQRLRVAPALVAAVVSVPAGAAGLAMIVGQPPGADGDPLLVVLPVLTLGVAGLVLGWQGRSAPGLRRRLLSGAAAVPLLSWGVLQVGALTRPIVPDPLAAGLLRPIVAAALALGAVALLEVARALLGAVPDTLDEG